MYLPRKSFSVTLLSRLIGQREGAADQGLAAAGRGPRAGLQSNRPCRNDERGKQQDEDCEDESATRGA